MDFALPVLATLATVTVAGVLVLGLRTMLKNESGNASQTFMRWRVLLQFVAIIVIMLTVWLTRGG
ncbi:MAG: twin transmembrane helix small protein [Pseudomonadota bacterium]